MSQFFRQAMQLFRGAPVLMTIALLLAGAVGLGIAYWQNQPELDALDARIEQLDAKIKELRGGFEK